MFPVPSARDRLAQIKFDRIFRQWPKPKANSFFKIARIRFDFARRIITFARSLTNSTIMADTQNSKAKAVLLLILLSLIWGTSFILIKRGLVVFSPGEVGSIRVAAASLFLLPFALTRMKQLESHHYPKLFASGMMGVFIPAFLFAAAQTKLASQ